MSDEPIPHKVSPSMMGAALLFGGTVSRCPASTSRCARPRIRPRHHVVSQAGGFQPRTATQSFLHQIGEGTLGMAQ